MRSWKSDSLFNTKAADDSESDGNNDETENESQMLQSRTNVVLALALALTHQLAERTVKEPGKFRFGSEM